LTRAIIAATFASLLILLGSPPLRNQFLNPGELSAPHSGEAFAKLHLQTNRSNQTCAACHVAGASGPGGILNAAFKAKPGPFSIAALGSAVPAEMTAIDSACQKCHTSHLFHQPNVVRDISCSFCHAEHRGSGPMLAPKDFHCAFCHGDAAVMAAAAAKGAELPQDAFHSRITPGQNIPQPSRPSDGFTQIINSFAGDHPEFRVIAENTRDPNTLKFNHALHLTGATIPRLPDGQKLDCASCHQPDTAGAYFRPVTFENNCRVCHSLQFDPETPGLTLPHGSADFVSAFLHSLPKQYGDFAVRNGITGADEQKQFVQGKLRQLQAQAISGNELEQRIFFSTATAGPRTQVGTVSGAVRALYPGCAYCHEVNSNAQAQPEIVKPLIQDRWLTRGRFDHSRHARIACTQCHQAVQSKVTADIILPGKDSCVVCHSPRGGVADSCVSCHKYHRDGKE
jgi:hypothetical protein